MEDEGEVCAGDHVGRIREDEGTGVRRDVDAVDVLDGAGVSIVGVLGEAIYDGIDILIVISLNFGIVVIVSKTGRGESGCRGG